MAHMKLYRRGSSGEAVRDIQSRLSAVGFDSGADGGGDFGEATDVAVREFQDARGLIVDGIVGR